MKPKTFVVALNESANIYMVVDEYRRQLGTGTKEVCEILAGISMKPNRASATLNTPSVSSSHENIHSAIKI
jgi:hypothetical protein